MQIEHYALKIASCLQCYNVLYFPTAYYSVYGVDSYTSLDRNDYWYLKSRSFSHLFGITVTNRTDYAIKIYAREVIFSTVNFSVNGVNLYKILDGTDYLDLKVADLIIELQLHRQITSIKAVKICVREVICFYSLLFCTWINLHYIFD